MHTQQRGYRVTGVGGPRQAAGGLAKGERRVAGGTARSGGAMLGSGPVCDV